MTSGLYLSHVRKLDFIARGTKMHVFITQEVITQQTMRTTLSAKQEENHAF